MIWEERLKIYDELVAKSSRFKRKGKTVPYTSANGYMFSQLNKAGEIGIRLPKTEFNAFLEKYNSTKFKSYGAVMREYVLVLEELLTDIDLLATYLEKGYDHVMSLEPK